MSSVIASNIPKTVSLDKVKEFFSFSGKVDSVDLKSSDDATNVYKVKFVNKEAVSNALLLTGAELDGKTVKIEEEPTFSAAVMPKEESKPPAYTTTPVGISAESTTNKLAAEVPLTAAGIASNEKTSAVAAGAASTPAASTSTGAASTTASPSTDIDQEHKPKAAIIAEYLSHGYVLSDQALEKAVALDKKHGFSDKFKSFLKGLDTKYHVQDRAVQTSEKYQLDKKLTKGRNDLSSYFEQAAKSPTGSKIHSFYSGIVKDTKDIHEEAKRLAELKKQKQATGNDLDEKR